MSWSGRPGKDGKADEDDLVIIERVSAVMQQNRDAYLHPSAEGAVKLSYSRFTETPEGTLALTPICVRTTESVYDENGYSETTTYEVDGNEVGTEEYIEKEEEIRASITEILPYSVFSYEGDDLSARYDLQMIGHAMSCEEAILYLQALIGDGGHPAEAETGAEAEAAPMPQVLSDAPSSYLLQGNVGAWFETMSVQPDGSIEMYSEDTNAGDAGEGYNGTIYYGYAHGTLSYQEMINDYTYSFKVASITSDGVEGEEAFEDRSSDYRMRYVFLGFDSSLGQTFYLYTPDAPVADLPESFQMSFWGVGGYQGDTLGAYAFYNVEWEQWFFPLTDELAADYQLVDGRHQMPPATLTVTGDQVNIRTGPGTEYEAIGSANRGMQLAVTGKSGNWYEVQYNGSTAYIIADYVTEGDITEGDDTFTVTEDGGTITVTANDVNIRSGPGTEYESIDKVSYGVPLAMTGKVGNWYQIDYNGTTAYIIEDYVVVTVLPE